MGSGQALFGLVVFLALFDSSQALKVCLEARRAWFQRHKQ